MDLDKFQDIITKYNVDGNGNPISVSKTEEQQIHPLRFNISTDVMDEFQGLRILNKEMYEVRNYDDLKDANQYWVDYNNGRAYFHSSLKGSAIRYNYSSVGQVLFSANRIFTKLDERGNVVELLSELIDLTREYIAILGTFEEATIVIRKLKESIEEAKQAKIDLDEAIEQAREDISKIEATGNYTVNITSGQWAMNSSTGFYEKEVVHTLFSEHVHVTFINADTNKSLVLPWEVKTRDRILISSDENVNVTVIMSASYFKSQLSFEPFSGGGIN